ncbi:MAG: hypothetical protein LCH30_11005 [Proteobacteria bacterium]|nr:hypothetical protein [Pseudomonadota bacterium]
MGVNYELAEIHSLATALEAWELFFGRFFSADIPAGVKVEFDPSIRQFKPRSNKAAKSLSFYNQAEKTFHSDDFDDFLNGQTVTIPEGMLLNEEGLAQTEKAINEGNFSSSTLNEHIFYALWLFKLNKINRQQMSTILARAQMPEETPIVQTFFILDKKGQFTKEAKELLLPILQEDTEYNLTDWHLERLRLLILALPKSEQTFYLSKPEKDASGFPPKTLKESLVRVDSWLSTQYQGEKYDLNPSFGTIEALQIALYGIHRAAASRTKIGKISIDEVHEGVSYNYRPTAISIPNSGVAATTKNIHHYDESPMPVVTAHDVYHSKLHNRIPPEFHLMLNHMIGEIRNYFKSLKWSKKIWKLVDREFPELGYGQYELDSPVKGALFFTVMGIKDQLFDKYYLELNEEGIAIVWHMVNAPEIWKNLYKIDVDCLGYPYQARLKEMKEFREALGDNNKPKSELLSFKYRLFCTMSRDDFQIINRLIDSLDNKFQEKLTFVRKTLPKNSIGLQYKEGKNTFFISQKNIKKIIPFLFINKFFTEKNEDNISRVFHALSHTFVSTYQPNSFSKKKLDNSLEQLNSIGEKLDLIERCYLKIINPDTYQRRNKIADTLFALFKNPLTASQRQHIDILKARAKELIEEKSINPEDKKALAWYLQHCAFIRCPTERFYFHFDSSIPKGFKP